MLIVLWALSAFTQRSLLHQGVILFIPIKPIDQADSFLSKLPEIELVSGNTLKQL